MPGFSPFVLIVGMIVSFPGTSSWDDYLFFLLFFCFGLSLILALFHEVCSAIVLKAIRYETCLVNTLSNSWGQLTPRHAKKLEVGWNAGGNGIVCLDMIIFSFQPSIFKVGTMCEDDKDVTFRVRDLGTLSWCFCCTSHGKVKKHWYVGKFLPGEKCTEMCSNLQGSVMCDLTKNFTILLCMRLGRHGLCIGPR